VGKNEPIDDRPPLPEGHIPKKKSVDDQLKDHLQEAEDHLIAAVELFTNVGRPSRHAGYRSRLIMAQESITALLREELVRERGLQRPEGKKHAR
jgi:hypothetical protein